MTKTLKKHVAIILAIFAAIFFLAGCGSSETAEKVYLEESEIDAALSDGDSYKGKYIELVGKVFNVDKDGDTIAMQVWYDVENADQQFIVYADKEMAGSVKEDDFIKVDGKITGTFTGENYFGGEIKALLIEAESLEVGGYDDLYAPAESTKEIGETKNQHGVSVTLDRIEYAKGEARVYVTVKNDSGDTASIYTYSAKAIQDGKQFEHQDNYEVGYDSDIGEVLDGASKEGIIRFKGLDPDKGFKLTMEAYSDNWDITLEDYVFEVE
jgi:hypothetical protein